MKVLLLVSQSRHVNLDADGCALCGWPGAVAALAYAGVCVLYRDCAWCADCGAVEEPHSATPDMSEVGFQFAQALNKFGRTGVPDTVCINLIYT